MHEELKRAVVAARRMDAINVADEPSRFLANHGDALLAAVELADSCRRVEIDHGEYEYFCGRNKFVAYRAAMNERKA